MIRVVPTRDKISSAIANSHDSTYLASLDYLETPRFSHMILPGVSASSILGWMPIIFRASISYFTSLLRQQKQKRRKVVVLLL